jgi:hypothetical protein
LYKLEFELPDASELVILYVRKYYFELPKQKITYSDVELFSERKEESTLVLDRGGQADSRGAARFASQVLNRCALTGAEAVRRTYLIVVLRPVFRAFPAATRRCRIRRRTIGR